uniref:Nucleotide-binding alpha-beta plait domain-containing protein n=1 Tax=Tanacetum cinerariifolium TaxID=118510 RepID=A0A6L2KNH5_TANCI|nr:nucleotide-binding alpha-beta plait domain-containing protein [Tanacetum cinerariifolium]
MGSYRSKEDDVSRISTSIYVSNFPESCSAKDLFHSFNQYGYIVDTFIPFKRAKDGKRFGFVRFINVFNVERLVSNLCTIWVDRSKFHANIARYHRSPLNNNKVPTKQKFGYNRNINNVRAKEGVTTSSSKSYVHAVKVKNMFGALECDSMPSIVLDDECLIFKDLSKALLGKVMLEFPSSKTKELIQENIKVGSWFSVLKQMSSDLIPEAKIVWVEIKGVPFKLWSKNTFKQIVAKWGELLDVDDQEKEGFHSKSYGFKDGDAKVQEGGMCENDSDEVEVLETVFKESLEQKVNQLEDPFEENQNRQERNSTNKGSKEDISGLGVWLKTGVDILMVVVYAPQDLRDKRANVFNAFIANAGLEEVPLGGSSDIPNGCNSCFIALILKVPDANLVKDFRPISLIGSLRINMCKSNIMGVNVGDKKVKFAASKLRCLILNTLFSYLGTKVGGNMSRVQAWTEVVDKASWVKWKSVLASKEKGGLGVSSLYALNRALWARVIKAIYSDDGQVGKVSRAESTAFWDDNWISGKVLKSSFPCIYALEIEKEVTVNSKMSDTRLENSLRRSIRGGVEQSLEGSREFYVASIRNIIDDNRLSTVDTRTLWKKYVPIKVNVLA